MECGPASMVLRRSAAIDAKFDKIFFNLSPENSVIVFLEKEKE